MGNSAPVPHLETQPTHKHPSVASDPSTTASPQKLYHKNNWNDSEDRILLMAGFGKEVSPREYEKIASMFADNPSAKSVQLRLSELREEQIRRLQPLGLLLPQTRIIRVMDDGSIPKDLDPRLDRYDIPWEGRNAKEGFGSKGNGATISNKTRNATRNGRASGLTPSHHDTAVKSGKQAEISEAQQPRTQLRESARLRASESRVQDPSLKRTLADTSTDSTTASIKRLKTSEQSESATTAVASGSLPPPKETQPKLSPLNITPEQYQQIVEESKRNFAKNWAKLEEEGGRKFENLKWHIERLERMKQNQLKQEAQAKRLVEGGMKCTDRTEIVGELNTDEVSSTSTLANDPDEGQSAPANVPSTRDESENVHQVEAFGGSDLHEVTSTNALENDKEGCSLQLGKFTTASASASANDNPSVYSTHGSNPPPSGNGAKHTHEPAATSTSCAKPKMTAKISNSDAPKRTVSLATRTHTLDVSREGVSVIDRNSTATSDSGLMMLASAAELHPELDME